MAKRLSKGFTLVELLIVVAIIGIIAAIAIPNLISAIQRGKQKRTMGDIRNIGTAVEEYVVDEAIAPQGTAGIVSTALNIAQFVPFYIRVLPTLDGWRNNTQYLRDTNVAYSLYSFGRDGSASYEAGDYDNKSFLYDIYFSNGQFTASPGQK